MLTACLSVVALLCCVFHAPAQMQETERPRLVVTTSAQFNKVPGTDYLMGCDFRLNGVITLVDTNRELVVLQDATGAVALHFPLKDSSLQVGQAVTLEGDNCLPYFAVFPNYPFRPDGRDIRSSFEGPSDWGEYNLTRMRGYVHPRVTGEYSFWIASDNSSELWLSENADPSRARKVGFIPRYDWVSPRQWGKYASQNSGPVFLKAGETYYIEALSEQTSGGEHLSVAWRGPGINQSVIASQYLTPWVSAESRTNGILREYWTNFSGGDLEGFVGPRKFESALTVANVRVTISGRGELPKPDLIALNQALLPKDNYRWVQAEGWLKFSGTENDEYSLELSDGQSTVQVRVPGQSPAISNRMRNVFVRVEGVCEGTYDQKGSLVAGLIWASENSITFLENVTTNSDVSAMEQSPQPINTGNAAQGFYGTRGVVTFNDRVFGNDYSFVQENSAVVAVDPRTAELRNQLKVGHYVDLGGALESGKPITTMKSLVIKDLGWQAMPQPLTQPFGSPASGNPEGRWSEVEGVVHSINTNGTLTILGKNGLAYLWISQTTSNEPGFSVDAKLRARGVLTQTLLDAPVLLVPSRKFVDVEEPAPETPFETRSHAIADIVPDKMESSWFHRVRVVGKVTYRDVRSFFVQDESGGIRVQSHDPSIVQEGDPIEVVAFPSGNGFGRTLTGAVLRPTAMVQSVRPKSLDLSDALSSDQSGTLVNVSATLLACKTNATGQRLELQEQQRVFVATLATGRGSIPGIAPGSRLRITGICNDETAGTALTNEKLPEKQFLPALNILLRSPQDVAVLSGPPWWTLKRTVTLVGMLFTVILVTLLWVHLLRRRMERQRAAQLVFSRRVLERLEDERRRIAINLHDSLGQILLVIKNHALVAIQRPPEAQALQDRLGQISGAASQAIEEVRQITHGLRPYQLDRLGLTQAIRASISQTTAESSISFAIRVQDIDGVFDKDAEIHVYRIVQEAVTNIVKHSAATEATVVIKKRTDAVSISIRDNGRGFDPAKRSSPQHVLGYGLSGIAERVRILGGTVAIDSRPGEGSSVTVEVPLPVNSHDTGSNHTDRG
jgi:signal transduction histidine kinase